MPIARSRQANVSRVPLPAVGVSKAPGIHLDSPVRGDAPVCPDGDWTHLLASGDASGAWLAFLSLHYTLMLSRIRRRSHDYDEVLSIFEYTCSALRKDDLARLRKYARKGTVRFSTWIATVVDNLIIDWFRLKNGRHGKSVAPAGLSPLQEDIFGYVFSQGYPHRECFETLKMGRWLDLSHHQYVRELRRVYAVAASVPRANGWYFEEEDNTDLLERTATPCDPIDERLSFEIVDAELGLCPEAVRAAVELYVMENRAANDVARAVGWRDATAVYNGVRRGLEGIRKRLGVRGVTRSAL